MRFIIATFGNNYTGFLLALLYSIKKNAPTAQVAVLWESIDEEKINPIKKIFSEFDFIKTNYNFGKNKAKRIASKTILWEHAAKQYAGENLCFLDVDILITKDITHFFDELYFNIGFTYKDEHYPLNTGVLLSDGSNKGINFFTSWKQKTMEIINDEILFAQANNTSLPYGAADQMSLFNMLKYQKENDQYNIFLLGNDTCFKGIPCRMLNETNSTSISFDTHIIHYKGVWQDVLIKGMNFSRYRTKKDSWEMYIYFLTQYKEAIEYMNKTLHTNYRADFFNIRIPAYMNKRTLQENSVLYIFHFIRNAFDRLLFLVSRKLKIS
ncbi:hypothetical protein COB64_00545 [Candidatus Wolfebacteria bacterium]|nr:MAG: hypothetical protein COB64_00545 [Candidatus Wolfebacteria bacterium]